MTKPLGRSARWGTVALVAPLAAGALAAATSWGVTHQPATSGTSSASGDASGEASDDGVQAVSALKETQGRDKSLIALQKQASTEQARVIRLQQILHRVNARTRDLARAPIPGYHGAAASTGSVTVGSSSAGGTVAAPPRVAAAPAPATHASTGAS